MKVYINQFDRSLSIRRDSWSLVRHLYIPKSVAGIYNLVTFTQVIPLV